MGATGNLQSKCKGLGNLLTLVPQTGSPGLLESWSVACFSGLSLRAAGWKAVCQHPARFPHLGTALAPEVQAGSKSPFNGRRQGTGEVSLGNWKESSCEKCVTI